MKPIKLVLLVAAFCMVGCSSSPVSTTLSSTVANSVRAYNGTASVGDFLTISVDPNAKTITYQNHTNGESGTVPYTVNADNSYTITDPNGNLLSAYEVPGYVMVVEAANAGPNKDTTALVTAIESVPVTVQTYAGQQFNMTQFRTLDGGVEIGTVSIDDSFNITARSYDPGAIMWTQGTYFNGGTMPASGTHEDTSGTFFTVTDPNQATQSTVFGTQNGLFAVDNSNGTVLGLPKAATKDFDPTVAGTYNAIYYEKQNAQMQNSGSTRTETGTPLEGKASITVSSAGAVTITDSQNNGQRDLTAGG